MTDRPPKDDLDLQSLEELQDASDTIDTAISTDYKVLGEKTAPGGTGVLGHNTATTGASHGVEGVTDASDLGAAGVRGQATAGSGAIYGVHGVAQSDDTDAAALHGEASNRAWALRATGKNRDGGWVNTTSPDSTGLMGSNDASSGTGYGIYGYSLSPGDASIGTRGAAFADSGVTFGVFGQTFSAGHNAAGVRGRALANTGKTRGVTGITDSQHDFASGVRGEATASTGIVYGVSGTNSSDERLAAAIHGRYRGNGEGWGVEGFTDSGAAGTAGLHGVATDGNAASFGVLGETDSSDSNAAAVAAEANGATGVRAKSTSGVGLEVTGADSGTNSDPLGHAAVIETNNNDTSNQILALKTAYTGDPTTTNNFVTFFNGNDNAYGSIEGDGSGGVTLNSGSADYAEYLPRLDPEEAIEPADVVGVVGGAVTKRTADANLALVVSDQPIVTGNAPGRDQDDRQNYEQVAFVGQVPVSVRGPVDEGDLIVPSGENDGVGRAIAPETRTPGDAPVVGRAWTATDGDHVQEVTVAVGVGTGGALDPAIAGHRERIDALERETEQLREELATKDERIAALAAENEELQARVSTLEADVAAIGGEGVSPAPSDD